MLQGGVTFGYDPAAGATKFMIGCESGSILSCNRKAKNPADRVAGVFAGHHGPVYSLKRHPFAPKYFMSIGDWTARIWAEDSKQPLITTKYHNTYLTGTARAVILLSKPNKLFLRYVNPTTITCSRFYIKKLGDVIGVLAKTTSLDPSSHDLR